MQNHLRRRSTDTQNQQTIRILKRAQLHICLQMKKIFHPPVDLLKRDMPVNHLLEALQTARLRVIPFRHPIMSPCPSTGKGSLLEMRAIQQIQQEIHHDQLEDPGEGPSPQEGTIISVSA